MRFSASPATAVVGEHFPAAAGLARHLLLKPGVDQTLRGSLIMAAAALPYVVEVLRQVPLQARVMAAMSPETRAALPPHPRHPWLAVFGSVRFFLALFRWALRDAADAPREIVALKREMRWSIFREALFAAGFVTTLVVLVERGWRPLWPHFAA